jgi:hypothetical protein
MSDIGMIGAQSALRFSPLRGRISGSNEFGLQYPSPFFDIAHTYLPATVKMMFRWCRYYFLVNPLINAVVFKMSEYPITDVLFDTERPELKDLWGSFLLDHLRYRAFQVEVGLDYHVYGNALISIFYPFIKLLECPQCKKKQFAKDADYRFQNFQFIIACRYCSHHGPAKVHDHYIKAPNGIRLLRWNPEDVDIRYNEITGDYEYYYEIPTTLKNDVIIGKKSTVETIPQLFIESMRQRKAVVFSKNNIYHFKRPTLAGKDRGWGTPMILPVLKNTFYLQIMRKAQESICLEHIVPLRILFPQSGSASSDPYSSVNLLSWRDQVASEIKRWRADCITPESYVETIDGIRQAKYITEGDLLKNKLGEFCKVIKKWERPLRENERVYKLKIDGLAAVQTIYSENHPIWSIAKSSEDKVINKPEFIEVKDLKCGDYVGYPVYERLLNQVPIINTSNLGAYTDLAFSIGTFEKVIPRNIKLADEEFLFKFLRALVDVIGEIKVSEVNFYTRNINLAEDIRQILLSLGIVPELNFYEFETLDALRYYTIKISGSYTQFLKFKWGKCSSPEILNSALGEFKDGYFWYRISGKYDATTETVIGFEMDGDSTFCTWGVATHNSNYIPILPLPIGNQTIGGDGRALMLNQEIRLESEQIIAGMGVPVELIFGGLSFSASNVSLRMLENTFLGYLQDHKSLLKWIIKNTAAYLGWSQVRTRFKPFKMADDLQRKAYLFQLNQAKKLSDESLLADAEFDSEKEDQIMEREATRRAGAIKKQQLLEAEIQGESQWVTMKWQQKAQSQQMKEQMAIQGEMAKDQMAFQGQMQQSMGQGGEVPPSQLELQVQGRHPELLQMPNPVQSPLTLRSVQPIPLTSTGEDFLGKTNVDLLLMGRQLADRFSGLDAMTKPQALAELKQRNPELHDVVLGLMMSGSQGPTQASTDSARPLPEQKPARRGPESSLI